MPGEVVNRLVAEIEAAAGQMVEENMVSIEMGLVDGDQIWKDTAESMLIGQSVSMRREVLSRLGF